MRMKDQNFYRPKDVDEKAKASGDSPAEIKYMDTMYDEKGELTEDKLKVCATVRQLDRKRFYYRVRAEMTGYLYDPTKRDSHYKIDAVTPRGALRFKLASTEKTCFENYISFLKDPKKSKLHLAEQQFRNYRN